MHKFPPDVTVVVIADSRRNALLATLQSLQLARCPPEQIRVIEISGRNPVTASLAARGVTVQPLSGGGSANAARNLGVMNAPTLYVLLIDSAVQIYPHTAHLLRAGLIDWKAAVAAPVIVSAGPRSRIIQAQPHLHFLGISVDSWLGRPPEELGTAVCEIGCASSQCLLVDRLAALHAGLFDERLNGGLEAEEFVHRVRLAGSQVVVVPRAQATQEDGASEQAEQLSPDALRSRWHLMVKTYQRSTLVALAPLCLAREILMMVWFVVQGRGLVYFSCVWGLLRQLSDLRADRASVGQVRVRNDLQVLVCEPVVRPQDFRHRRLIAWYHGCADRLLQSYWHFAGWLITRQQRFVCNRGRRKFEGSLSTARLAAQGTTFPSSGRSRTGTAIVPQANGATVGRGGIASQPGRPTDHLPGDGAQSG